MGICSATRSSAPSRRCIHANIVGRDIVGARRGRRVRGCFCRHHCYEGARVAGGADSHSAVSRGRIHRGEKDEQHRRCNAIHRCRQWQTPDELLEATLRLGPMPRSTKPSAPAATRFVSALSSLAKSAACGAFCRHQLRCRRAKARLCPGCSLAKVAWRRFLRTSASLPAGKDATLPACSFRSMSTLLGRFV